MNMTTVRPFLEAMQSREGACLAHYLNDQVTFYTPIRVDPLKGKAIVAKRLTILLQVIDRFEITEALETSTRSFVHARIYADEWVVEAAHDIHHDVDGLISNITMYWSPLTALVAMQQRMTMAPGLQTLKLVPA